MPTDGVSLRQLYRHFQNTPPTSFRLREMMLRAGNANPRLRVQRAPFSLMTQNMALLVAPGNYLGTDRDGAIAEIVAQILVLAPDVVGLCEVFDDDERNKIRGRVRHMYPHFMEGPDEADLESDGGLLLLSKHPIIQHHAIIFRDCAGPDCLANKGFLHARVQPPGWPTPIDVFYTHAQNIAEKGGEQALYAQLTRMGGMIKVYADPKAPTFIFGDLNIPGEVPRHYEQLFLRLGDPVDLWTVAGYGLDTGFTSIANNNFYEDKDDAPSEDQRLDYILMKAGTKFIPILSKIELLQFVRNGRFISDHFGVHAKFERLVQVDA